MDANIIPVAAIIPTRHRSETLSRTLESLAKQSVQPLEIVINDASDDLGTKDLCTMEIPGLASRIAYLRATCLGAAAQRNEAMRYITQPFVLLMDDDIYFEPDCLRVMWTVLNSDPLLGGVGATIINQQYGKPSFISRTMFRIMAGESAPSYAGRVIGPAVNLLPADHADLPEIVLVDWLSTVCVMYRTEALPKPLFPDWFVGYSLMEDVTLSLTVGKAWKLVNARIARIYHDSQPGSHKSNTAELAQMALINRCYVMREVLHRTAIGDYARLALWHAFCDIALLRQPGMWRSLPGRLLGELRGATRLLTSA